MNTIGIISIILLGLFSVIITLYFSFSEDSVNYKINWDLIPSDSWNYKSDEVLKKTDNYVYKASIETFNNNNFE